MLCPQKQCLLMILHHENQNKTYIESTDTEGTDFPIQPDSGSTPPRGKTKQTHLGTKHRRTFETLCMHTEGKLVPTRKPNKN